MTFKMSLHTNETCVAAYTKAEGQAAGLKPHARDSRKSPLA